MNPTLSLRVKAAVPYIYSGNQQEGPWTKVQTPNYTIIGQSFFAIYLCRLQSCWFIQRVFIYIYSGWLVDWCLAASWPLANHERLIILYRQAVKESCLNGFFTTSARRTIGSVHPVEKKVAQHEWTGFGLFLSDVQTMFAQKWICHDLGKSIIKCVWKGTSFDWYLHVFAENGGPTKVGHVQSRNHMNSAWAILCPVDSSLLVCLTKGWLKARIEKRTTKKDGRFAPWVGPRHAKPPTTLDHWVKRWNRPGMISRRIMETDRTRMDLLTLMSNFSVRFFPSCFDKPNIDATTQRLPSMQPIPLAFAWHCMFSTPHIFRFSVSFLALHSCADCQKS